jgi:CheY-like chemotaxis protein
MHAMPSLTELPPAADVLIVEDDPDIRGLLREVVEEAGCVAHEATNGQDALETLGRHAPPRLILLDMMMPVMDGATFLSRMRQVPQWLEVPVVVVSASPHVPRDVEAVLPKPVDLGELLQTVARYCPAACAAPGPGPAGPDAARA